MEKYSFKINGHDYEVEAGPVSGRNALVRVNGTEYDVEIVSDGTEPDGIVSGTESSGTGLGSHEGRAASGNGADALNVRQAGNAGGPGSKPAASGAAQGGETVTAPLPGVIVDVKVKVGDSVKVGQTVAVLEAMKMENEIEAPMSGTVTAVSAAKGDSVLEGAAIVTIG